METGQGVIDALETYKNGNITDFKEWLRTASKPQIVHITYLWLKSGENMLKLKSYVMDVSQ